MRIHFTAILIILTCFLCTCSRNSKEINSDENIHFTSLPYSKTNIAFNNLITENDSVNLIANAYAYMGSGVGIGDFNNDGLPDIFFGASQQSSRLYINKGNLSFDDITEKAGVHTSVWVTGVSIIDINSDGYDDMYVCVSGSKNAEKRRNLLYINNHNLTFSEQAASYGLDDTSYSTQAVFFDYDKDGDLDMYLLNHLLNHQQSNNIVARDVSGSAPSRDKLFRNNGIKKGGSHPYYEDVSKAAGIIEDGYGLGVVMSDVNHDNWPDLYVANDYLANDLLWINNKNGTFSNTIARSTKHQSYSSMGVDAGDVNNDGLPDIISLDMQPEDNKRKKMMYSFLNYDRYVLERNAGYEDEYMRNMLQLNNGLRNVRDTLVPFFSEIGQMAGISETDWSWSVLMADFDNDGLKDVYITNGLGRDMLNNDFISFAMETYSTNSGSREEMNRMVVKKLTGYGSVELSDYCFRNKGNLSFADVTKTAGLDIPSISNGCAYADLDNDGDLDLVVNNINKVAFIFRNDAEGQAQTPHNYIKVSLKGDSLNCNGFGARLIVYAGGKMQMAEQAPVRGYLSSMDKRLHVGLGNASIIDSLIIQWPDGRRQILKKPGVNKMIELKQADADISEDMVQFQASSLFTDVTDEMGIDFRHKETFFYDYGFQQTLPQKYSQLGPFITEGDINGDGLTDFFVGGAAKQPGRVFMQQSNGHFISKDITAEGKPQEDLGCLLFDADGDKDLDLFVNSGGNEFKPGSSNYIPRLYKNDGSGNFTLDEEALPFTIFTSAQCVAGADYDADGDIDLFIGGRVSPNQYPVSPASYLLQNNGGVFTDVTSEVCAALQFPGMISAVIWTDINNDKKPDLIIAGEWMPVRFFINENGKLNERTSETMLPDMSGQWRSLAAADIDKDGDMDIVAGNLGLNTKYRVSQKQPLQLFASDLDGNGSIDPIIAYYIKNEKSERGLYPAISRDQFAAQVPFIKKKFFFYSDYAEADINKIFSDDDQQNMMRLVCKETRSVWIENKGNGKFTIHALPVEAQVSTINTIFCTDADGDGYTDIIIAGNEYQTEVSTGRYDASYGLLIKGDGKGNFKAIAPAVSGLIIDGDVRDIKLLTMANKKRIILTGINDEKIRAYQLR